MNETTSSMVAVKLLEEVERFGSKLLLGALENISAPKGWLFYGPTWDEGNWYAIAIHECGDMVRQSGDCRERVAFERLLWVMKWEANHGH